MLYSNTQITHCSVIDKSSQIKYKMAFVCGNNDNARRKELWKQLRALNVIINEPWLILGDFNTMLLVEDRINGIPVSQDEITDF